MIKKILTTVALLGALTVGGCSANKIPNDPTDPKFPTAVQVVKNETNTGVVFATTGVLMGFKGEDRARVAVQANQVAKQVKTAVETNQLNLAGLKDFAIKQVTESDLKDKEMVGLMLNSALAIVESNLNIKFDDIQGDTRQQVGRELVLSAVDAVIRVTQPYVK